MKRRTWIIAALAASAVFVTLAYRWLNARENTLWAADAGTGAVRWARAAGSDDFYFETYASANTVIVRQIDAQQTSKRRYAAYDAASGAPLWTYDPPEGIESRIRTHDEGGLIAGGAGDEIFLLQLIRRGAGDPVDMLLALDGRTGRTLWTRDISFTNRMLTADNAPLVLIQDAAVVCIESATGAIRWRKDYTSGVSLRSTALGADGLAIMRSDEAFVLDLADGADRFKLAETFDLAAIADDTLYWENDETVGATRLRDQQALWRTTLPEGYDSDALAIDSDMLYLSTRGLQDETLELFAFDRQNGAQRWQTMIGNDTHVSGHPIPSNDALLYFPVLDNAVSLSKRDGRIRWRLVNSSPYGSVGGRNNETVLAVASGTRWQDLVARYIVGRLPVPAPDEDSQP